MSRIPLPSMACDSRVTHDHGSPVPGPYVDVGAPADLEAILVVAISIGFVPHETAPRTVLREGITPLWANVIMLPGNCPVPARSNQVRNRWSPDWKTPDRGVRGKPLRSVRRTGWVSPIESPTHREGHCPGNPSPTRSCPVRDRATAIRKDSQSITTQMTERPGWVEVRLSQHNPIRNIFSIFRPFASSSTSLSKYLTCCVNGFSISSTR